MTDDEESAPGQIIMAIALILTVGAVAMNSWLFIHSFEVDDDLCTNQHAMIELQRVFLKEHEALRVDMARVGVSNEHDQHLLDEIAVLIERADCRPNEE